MNYAIACSKIWDDNLANKLQEKLNSEFLLIQKREALTVSNLRKNKIEKVFFPHWSYIIQEDIFANFECIIFHMTDLPYGRGGSPLQNLIVRGHKTTKISALRCVQGLDAGPIYLKKDLSLNGTATEIFSRATAVIKEMIVEIINEDPTPIEQSGEIVEFKRRSPSESDISNLNDLPTVYDYIRMLDADGYPPAFIETQDMKFEFYSATLSNGQLEAKVKVIKK